ncbi:MAG: TatD family hydrolase [Chloroflexota bacterium]
MILTDTHCHLDFSKFDPDRVAVLERSAQAGVTHILIPGLTLASSRGVVKLVQSHPMLHAAIGVHPTDALTWTRSTQDDLRQLAEIEKRGHPSGDSKIVAIGEIGLDYYWDSAPHELQQSVLNEQLTLAENLGIPVVLHMREAKDALHGTCAEDLLTILENWMAKLRSNQNSLAERPGVLHSFSGSLDTAIRAIELGFSIGITGPVTFQNASRRQEITAQIELDRLLIETDAPFLAPHPQRGRRNEPANVRLIADKIGVLKSKDPEEIAAVTTDNAKRLFAWGE